MFASIGAFSTFPVVFPFADMIRRRNLRTRAIKMLVLDEADEMLNKGLVPDTTLFRTVPRILNRVVSGLRLQGADLRYLPVPAAGHAGGAVVGHAAA